MEALKGIKSQEDLDKAYRIVEDFLVSRLYELTISGAVSFLERIGSLAVIVKVMDDVLVTTGGASTNITISTDPIGLLISIITLVKSFPEGINMLRQLQRRLREEVGYIFGNEFFQSYNAIIQGGP